MTQTPDFTPAAPERPAADTASTPDAPATPKTLAIIGGAGHLAAMAFHQQVHQHTLDATFITSDTDLFDVVHLGFGLGEADGHFNPAHTERWLERNTRALDAVAPDLVVAVCNTIQPTLHQHLAASSWPMLDNLNVLHAAAQTMTNTPVWLASRAAYAQGLFPYPGDALADVAEDMIATGMNGLASASVLFRLRRLLRDLTQPQSGVILACTDLTPYAAPLRAGGFEVVEAVEELALAAHAILVSNPTRATRTAHATRAFEEATR